MPKNVFFLRPHTAAYQDLHSVLYELLVHSVAPFLFRRIYDVRNGHRKDARMFLFMSDEPVSQIVFYQCAARQTNSRQKIDLFRSRSFRTGLFR